jgi:hypothetical protein
MNIITTITITKIKANAHNKSIAIINTGMKNVRTTLFKIIITKTTLAPSKINPPNYPKYKTMQTIIIILIITIMHTIILQIR